MMAMELDEQTTKDLVELLEWAEHTAPPKLREGLNRLLDQMPSIECKAYIVLVTPGTFGQQKSNIHCILPKGHHRYVGPIGLPSSGGCCTLPLGDEIHSGPYHRTREDLWQDD